MRVCALILRATAGVVLVSSGLVAQFVVPAYLATTDGPSVGSVPGFGTRGRQQILVDVGPLAPIQGRTLVAMWLRRDGGWPYPLASSQSDVTILMSAARRSAGDPSPVFAANAGLAPVTVFTGRVTLPASPQLSSPDVPWDSANAVRIPFSAGFLYGGGTLCIEITGAPVSGAGPAYWPVDFDYTGTAGRVTRRGAACGVYAGRSAVTADAQDGSLRLGHTAVFLAWGQPSTPAVFLLAATALSQPVSLTPLGATGCQLHLQPAWTTSTSFGTSVRTNDSGTAEQTLQLPVMPVLAGGKLFAQWANLETSLPPASWSNPAGITTSNLVEATLSTSLPTSGMATIATPALPPGVAFPAAGETNVTKAPVMRFELQ